MARQDVLQEGLEEILARYLTARTSEPFGKSHDLWSVFQSIERKLEESDPVKRHSTLHVFWSVGQGNWARIPWIALLDERETSTVQEGVYCVFLFRQDMSGVYLTYNQGVTALNKEHGRPEARGILRSRGTALRDRSGSLLEYGFSMDHQIDLHTDANLGRDYEHSTIAYKLYEKGDIPPDDEILEDLTAVVDVYEAHLPTDYDLSESDSPKVSDVEPPVFDILKGDHPAEF